MRISFPEGFLWGTATAAHQVEGNNVYNDAWLMEHAPFSIYTEPSGDACDHYHRYPEDLTLLAELGFNAYRFSLEWSRIEPEEGEFSRAELDHYRRVLLACHERGLTPIVTFHHFTSPRWLIAQGGWENGQTAEKFARFCEVAGRHLGDLIGSACTLNEPNMGRILAVLMGVASEQLYQARGWIAAAEALRIPPDQLAPFIFSSSPRALNTLLEAHRRGVEVLKAGPGAFPVGLTLALQDIQPTTGGEALAGRIRQEIHDVFLEAVRGDDFVGVQGYSRACIGPEGVLLPEPNAEVTQMGYEFYPEALEASIRHAIAVAGIPVIVTENGIATADDTRRIEYIRRALMGVANCLRDGLDVRGYMYWSTFDNFEWQMGYRPTFGLIGVDRETQKRTAKSSAYWLGEVARANGFEIEP